MKINWFSPLPPARTDIANHTMLLLPELCRLADLVIWTDQDEVNPVVADYGTLYRYTAEDIDLVALNSADATVYHLGNNAAFHANILRVSKKFPGILVLHDLVLQGLFLPWLQENDTSPDQYCRMMRRYYGDVGVSAWEANQRGEIDLDSYIAQFPLYLPAVDNALAVVTHSRFAFTSLANEDSCPVACIPLAYHPSVGDKPSPVHSFPLRLVVFGFIGANRRLEAIFDALSGMEHSSCFHLDIIGSIWDEPLIRRQIEDKKLSGSVTVHGFVPETELARLLGGAHLAINLRFPTMGETSGSQLRIWENRLPSLVSRVGWYAELPEDVVAFVHPDHEVEDIRRHLTDFLENPQYFAVMGDKGYRFLVEHHLPGNYARRLVAFAGNTVEFHLRHMSKILANRAAQTLAPWLSVENGFYCIERVACRITEMVSD